MMTDRDESPSGIFVNIHNKILVIKLTKPVMVILNEVTIIAKLLYSIGLGVLCRCFDFSFHSVFMSIYHV